MRSLIRAGLERRAFDPANWGADPSAIPSNGSLAGSLSGLLSSVTSWSSSPVEKIDESFAGIVQGVVQRNGIVAAAVAARMRLFSEISFGFGERGSQAVTYERGRGLELLEEPDRQTSTQLMLAFMEFDASTSGNAYLHTLGSDRLVRMRPDWVTIVLGSQEDREHPAWALDAQVAGYLYHPGGRRSKQPAKMLLPSQVVHWMPEPDPLYRHRGQSWIASVLEEIAADNKATAHKSKFFDNSATPNLAVNFGDAVKTVEQFNELVEQSEREHAGLANAYRTLYMMAGGSVTAVGSDLKQLDFKATQGAGETRIALRSGVPAPILGISEGLAGSSLNAGNYGQARRHLADGLLSSNWRSVTGAFRHIVLPPDGKHLVPDKSGVPFLQDDAKDAAEIKTLDAAAIRTLVDAGYKAESVITAVKAGDMSLLEHSGLFSVQLQPPGTGQAPPEPDDDEGDDDA